MTKASAYYKVDRIKGKNDIGKVKQVLDKLGGVSSVSSNGQDIAVDYDTTGVRQDQIRRKLKRLGYNVTDVRVSNHIM